jgi:hypothetical protein
LPLLSQAILQAQAGARSISRSAAPLAVIASSCIPENLLPIVQGFVSDYAPSVAIGIIDLEGLRYFAGRGLESLNAPIGERPKRIASQASASHLFSDLNQWLLKVLLAPRIPERLLAAPRNEYRNASELAAASGASMMSAFRFVRQLQEEGFLDEREDQLRLVRVDELMHRWQAASLRVPKDRPMRWILRGSSEEQLREAVRSYKKSLGKPKSRRKIAFPLPQVCLGLFAAADALGVGFVRGAPAHLYVERLEEQVVDSLGLAPAEAGHRADVYLRVPLAKRAVFGAAVDQNGVPVSDILQVWLDVSSHPSRGKEQAEEIKRRYLSPLFDGRH